MGGNILCYIPNENDTRIDRHPRQRDRQARTNKGEENNKDPGSHPDKCETEILLQQSVKTKSNIESSIVGA